MDEFETADELEKLIADMHLSLHRMGRIGRESDHVQEMRIDQYARQMLSAVDYLYTVQDETLDVIYADVKSTLVSDPEYAVEFIMHWISKGDDVEIIAGRLETTTDVILGVLDECGRSVDQ